MKKNQVKMIMKKMAVLAAAVILGVGGKSVTSQAAMGGGRFVSIEQGVADSICVNGITVDALYKPYGSGYDSDPTYCCAAFVKRFYSQVYGKNVYNLWSVTSVPQMDNGSFRKTTDPKTGDILRDNESAHWAIVKEVNGNTVTLIQQNAWDHSYTKAWVGATAQKTDTRYTYFTWEGNTGASQNTEQKFSFQYHSLERYDHNAVIHTKVKNPGRLTVQKVGCKIYDKNSNVIKEHTETCLRQESTFNIWYDFNGELGLTLEPGTEYMYQFFVEYGGVKYEGEIEKFTTTGKKQSSDLSSETVKKEMSKECGDAPSLKYGKDGFMSLQYLVGVSGADTEEYLGDPEKEKNNVSYYPAERCGAFSTMAPVALEMENGKVSRVTWKYTYKNSSDEAKSKKFYKKAAKIADTVFGQEGTGICQRKNQMTTTWENMAQMEWSMEDGVPVITITVEGAR